MKYLTHEHGAAKSHLVPECVTSVQTTLKEITFTGRRPTTPTIRKRVLEKLHQAGWSEEAKLDAASSITITSVRSGVGLCLQTGNMARIYADLLKLQLLYQRKRIVGAIFVTFSKATANELGENIANFDRLTNELDIFREVITVPALVFGLEVGNQ